MEQNIESLTKMITKRVEDSRLFVSKNEWNQIHEYIKTAGTYSHPRFQVAVEGDSALMIAVRLRSFKAAKVRLTALLDSFSNLLFSPPFRSFFSETVWTRQYSTVRARR